MRTEEKIAVALVIFGLGFIGGFLTPVDIEFLQPFYTYVLVLVLVVISILFAYKKII